MRRNLFISNFKNLPWGLMICLLLFGITEGYLRLSFDKVLPEIDVVFLEKKHVLDNPRSPAAEGLMIGDSRIYYLDSEQLNADVSAALGRDFFIYNSALPYQDIRGYYLTLKRYLARHRPPRVVFLAAMPESIFVGWNITGPMETRENYIHRFCMLYSLRDCLEVFPPRFWPEIVSAEIEHYSFIATFRGRWRGVVGEQFDLRKDFAKAISSLGMTADKSSNSEEDALRKKLFLIKNSSFNNHTDAVNPQSAYWMERFFALAHDHHILVVVFNAPILDQYFVQREKTAFFYRYQFIMDRFQQRYDNITILPPLVQAYDWKYFRDSNHLNDEGLEIYSRTLFPQIADAIKGR